MSNECVEAKAGSHVFEDHFLPEIIDPQTGQVLAPGRVGELVLTTLTKEAIPVIRYRTGDVASLTVDPCVCGRTHARMSAVLGRTDDMLIIRGVNVYPSQVETALLGIDDLSPHYQLVVRRPRTLDELEVKIETSEPFAKGVGAIDAGDPRVRALAGRCAQVLQSALGLSAQVTLTAPGSLPRSEGGKLRRVLDERTLT